MKQQIKIAADIRRFLGLCGFQYTAAGNGCHEFTKEKKGDKLYCYQINGEGLAEIKSPNEKIIFSINGIDPSVTPLAIYTKEYPNLQALVDGEKEKINFEPAFEKWTL